MAVLPLQDPPSDLPQFAPFWEALARSRLVLPRCSVCGQWQWYPETNGTDCTGGELRWEEVPTSGTIYSFTRVHRSFLPGGRDQVPFVVALIDLDDVAGPRLVANLDDSDQLAIGSKVTARFEPLATRVHPVFHLVGPSGDG